MATDRIPKTQRQMPPPVQQVPLPSPQAPPVARQELETPPETPPPGPLPPQQQQYYPPQQYRAPNNSLGTSSLVLGIIGTALDLSSLVVLWPLCILALLLGGAGLSQGISNRGRIKKGEATNQTATTAGIVFSALAIGMSVIFILLVVIAHIAA